MTYRGRFHRLVCAAILVASAPARVRAVTEPPPDPVRLGLYEWMGVASSVVIADIVVDDARFVAATIRAPIKGELDAGATVLIDLRQANRDRDYDLPAADLTKGRGYLLLLKPSSKGKREPHPVFDLVRGAAGVKPLPLEGSAATIDAAVRLGGLQSRHDDDLLWATLPEFLEDTNPVLVEAALELYVKFRRESAELVPVLLPLLDHPRPDFRRRAALLLGRALARPRAASLPERSAFVAELTGRARRDEDATVRREATAALAALPDAGIDEVLRAITRDDSDQDVRFEAEKSLFERRPDSAPKRSD